MRSGRDRTVLGNTGPVLACIAIESYTIQFNNRHCIFKRLFLKETLHYVLGKQDCFVQYASSSLSKKFCWKKKTKRALMSLLGDFARIFKLYQVRNSHTNNTAGPDRFAFYFVCLRWNWKGNIPQINLVAILPFNILIVTDNSTSLKSVSYTHLTLPTKLEV